MAKTQVSKNFGTSSLEVSLEQLYLQKDANQKKLPAVIDLGLRFQTPITFKRQLPKISALLPELTTCLIPSTVVLAIYQTKAGLLASP